MNPLKAIFFFFWYGFDDILEVDFGNVDLYFCYGSPQFFFRFLGFAFSIPPHQKWLHGYGALVCLESPLMQGFDCSVP